MRNMCAKIYETLNKIGDVLTSPKLMAEFYRRQYLGMKEIIGLCKKHYQWLLLPTFSILSSVCWIGWKTFLLLARFEEWLSSLFQSKKNMNGITWE